MFANVEFNAATSEGGGYQIQVLQQGAYKNSIVASGITNNSTNYLAFSTTNEAVRITSAGNVGIGTASPNSLLGVGSTLAGWSGNAIASSAYITGANQATGFAAGQNLFIGSNTSQAADVGG